MQSVIHHQYTDVHAALDDLSQGKMILLFDDKQRENEGDLILAAQYVTPEKINFMLQYARGLICLPLAEAYVQRLALPLMIKRPANRSICDFTVSIEAASGVTTGISAADRARTIQVAIDPESTSEDIVTPGHIFPIKACPGGLLVRQGHTEASIELMRLARLEPAAVICEVLQPDGTMLRPAASDAFVRTHKIRPVFINDLINYCHHLQVAHA